MGVADFFLESGFWRDVVQKGRKPLSKLYISLCLI